MANPDSPTSGYNRGFAWFIRLWAGFALLLFASTWKLWTPQTEFPQIPVFHHLIDVPGWFDWIAIGAAGLGLLGCLVVRSRQWMVASLAIFSMATCCLILLNQHRLQPWAYQFLVFAIILAVARPRSACFWMRWIVISIYLYSAVSKFDYQFIHTVGDQMLTQCLSRLGIDDIGWSGATRNRIVFGFPVAECLIGLGLMIPRTRRIAMPAAILMHLTLIVTLIGNVAGPGVIIWNAFFIVQAFFLFGPILNPVTPSRVIEDPAKRGSALQPSVDPCSSFPLEWAGVALAILVLVFPLTQPLGICDHWLAWQVYAPRCSRANLVQFAERGEKWNDCSNWSTSTLAVPVYPQARFQLAVAMAAQRRFPDAAACPIEMAGVSNRWNGEREKVILTGDQPRMTAERFWLNVTPRSIWTQADPNAVPQ